MKYALAILLWLIWTPTVLLGQHTTGSLTYCPPQPSAAEIYLKALDVVRVDSGAARRDILLLGQTSTEFPPGISATTLRGASKLLQMAAESTKKGLDNFRFIQCDLPVEMGNGKNLRIVSTAKEGELFPLGIGLWDDFHRKFPNAQGFVAFSPIAYNTPKDEALVFVSKSRSLTCGFGFLVLLNKVSGDWKLKNVALYWASSPATKLDMEHCFQTE